MTAADVFSRLVANPWLLAYAAGIVTGWNLSRHVTRYMLGGRP